MLHDFDRLIREGLGNDSNFDFPYGFPFPQVIYAETRNSSLRACLFWKSYSTMQVSQQDESTPQPTPKTLIDTEMVVADIKNNNFGIQKGEVQHAPVSTTQWCIEQATKNKGIFPSSVNDLVSNPSLVFRFNPTRGHEGSSTAYAHYLKQPNLYCTFLVHGGDSVNIMTMGLGIPNFGGFTRIQLQEPVPELIKYSSLILPSK